MILFYTVMLPFYMWILFDHLKSNDLYKVQNAMVLVHCYDMIYCSISYKTGSVKSRYIDLILILMKMCLFSPYILLTENDSTFVMKRNNPSGWSRYVANIFTNFAVDFLLFLL